MRREDVQAASLAAIAFTEALALFWIRAEQTADFEEVDRDYPESFAVIQKGEALAKAMLKIKRPGEH